MPRLVKDFGDVPLIDGNESRLGQVFLNLLLNAAQAIPEGEAAANGRRSVFFVVRPDRDQLRRLAALIDSGALRPVIAETVPLAKAREAFERGVAGHTRGKLVLAVERP